MCLQVALGASEEMGCLPGDRLAVMSEAKNLPVAASVSNDQSRLSVFSMRDGGLPQLGGVATLDTFTYPYVLSIAAVFIPCKNWQRQNIWVHL